MNNRKQRFLNSWKVLHLQAYRTTLTGEHNFLLSHPMKWEPAAGVRTHRETRLDTHRLRGTAAGVLTHRETRLDTHRLGNTRNVTFPEILNCGKKRNKRKTEKVPGRHGKNGKNKHLIFSSKKLTLLQELKGVTLWKIYCFRNPPLILSWTRWVQSAPCQSVYGQIPYKFHIPYPTKLLISSYLHIYRLYSLFITIKFKPNYRWEEIFFTYLKH
jgi:hypothetical protein